MRNRVAFLIAASALSALLPASARPAKGEATFRDNCGPVLCIPLPEGWFGSVGPGVVDGRSAAWLLAGNFALPLDAAAHEGTPFVPRSKLLIAMSDFPVAGASLHWRSVERLRLPATTSADRAVAWHVRFAGRALSISVRFGSKPDRQIQALANATLATVHQRR